MPALTVAPGQTSAQLVAVAWMEDAISAATRATIELERAGLSSSPVEEAISALEGALTLVEQ